MLPLIQQRSRVLRENLFRLGKLREVDRRRAAFDGGQMFPDFVGGEGEDGRGKADKRFGDLPQHRLRGTASLAGERERVHAVLEHIEIKGAQIDDGELVYSLIDTMEFESFVPCKNLFRQVAGAGKHVAVER